MILRCRFEYFSAQSITPHQATSSTPAVKDIATSQSILLIGYYNEVSNTQFALYKGAKNLLLAHLESAYSLIWGILQIWGQDLGTFMISRPN